MRISYRYFIGSGLAAAIALVIFISPVASSLPDGLEKVAEEKGFIEKGRQPVWTHAPMPDYQLPLKGRMPGVLAGVAGTLLACGAAYGIAFAVANRKNGGNDR